MSKIRLKQALAVALMLIAIPSVAFVTARLGNVVERAETGADSRAALTEVIVPVDPGDIEWLEDPPLPREMEVATRHAVGEAYLVSLGLLEGSLAVGAQDDLAVHLTGPALEAAREQRVRAPVVARTHRVQVVFYSADGQIVELVDEATRALWVADAGPVIRTEVAVALLLQIDGVWHLRHRIVEDGAVARATGLEALFPTMRDLEEREETL